MDRQYFYGAVPRKSLNTTINSGATSIIGDDLSAWPTVGPFTITLERDTANEERVLIQSRSGNTLTVATSGRGYDGTSAQVHTASSTTYIEHTISGEWVDQVAEALALQTTKGDLMGHNGTAQVRKGVGTNGYPLVARSTDAAGIAYEQLASAGLVDLAVTTAKIDDLAVTSGKLAVDAVGATQIAASAVGTAELADANVTRAKFATVARGVVDDDLTDTTVANTVTETSLVALSIPSGDAAANVVYRAVFFGEYLQNAFPTEGASMRLKIGSTSVALLTTFQGVGQASDPRRWMLDWQVVCSGTAAQENIFRFEYSNFDLETILFWSSVEGLTTGGSGIGRTASTVDMSGAVDLALLVTLGGTADPNHSCTIRRAFLTRMF